LGTVKQLIIKFRKNLGYRVKSGKIAGKSVEDLKKVRDEILRRRGELQEVVHSPVDDDSWEREMEGNGLSTADFDKPMKELYVSVGWIRAGNTSAKLRNQVVDLLKVLLRRGMINEVQGQKLFDKYIA